MAIKTDTFTGGGGGAVDSVNGQTGVVVVSGNDIAADHSAANYTAANANVDGHLSGIDTRPHLSRRFQCDHWRSINRQCFTG
jgi:hypothetical protein